MKVPAVLIDESSSIYKILVDAATTQRAVFLAGLSGVGKTLMVQQLALIAHSQFREVHLLQWDIARSAFETPAILGRYPEVNGVTHAAIRKAAGLWCRSAVTAWDKAQSDPAAILIGELPLIGNRLVELVVPAIDDAEAFLRSDRAQFLVPVPSRRLRRAISAARAREMAQPRHERDRSNAPPDLLNAHWVELLAVARKLGLNGDGSEGEFDPDLYAAVYMHLLRFRKARLLTIDELLPVGGSPYQLGVEPRELRATGDEVAQIMSRVVAMPDRILEAEVAAWYDF